MARHYQDDILNARRTLPHWFDTAACRGEDIDLFFPDEGDEVREHAAKSVCNTCPIRQACRSWALSVNQRHGIWGATTPKERQQIRRRRRATTAMP